MTGHRFLQCAALSMAIGFAEWGQWVTSFGFLQRVGTRFASCKYQEPLQILKLPGNDAVTKEYAL